ncbi:MAG: VCBS repeat-containing protein [Bdellovibrionales bacterium]|nr:VCBS repeat-containing protein [Bdellovibrionales bacterium]
MLSVRTNLAAIRSRRILGGTTRALEESFNRLSSGLRINRASDDAAGLAIAESLKSDARVYSQGIRNINDGLGLLNIAEGGLSELSGVLIRVRELTTQAANGTLSLTQRHALDEEANALIQEYNRITSTTEFNGLQLLDASLSELTIQAGFGELGSLLLGLGGELAKDVGDGTYADTSIDVTLGTELQGVAVGDLNGDGLNDLIGGDADSATLFYRLANSDGTFQAEQTLDPGLGNVDVFTAIADLNNDGYNDVVAQAGSYLSVFLGDGAGGFSSAINSADGNGGNFNLTDINNDGNLDVYGSRNGELIVSFGNGDGTFDSPVVSATGIATATAQFGDFNGDSIVDALVRDGSGNAQIFSGAVSGTFTNTSQLTTVNAASSFTVGDVNNDGLDDIISGSAAGNVIEIYLSTGSGFELDQTIAETNPSVLRMIDVNGDGHEDMLTRRFAGSAMLDIRLNDGEGNFSTADSIDLTGAGEFVLADISNDGVLDVLLYPADSTPVSIYEANTESSTQLAAVNINTQVRARATMNQLDKALERISSELGAIGSFQSRLEVAANTLRTTTTNYADAASRIEDVDVASEAANLARVSVLQQAGAAVLSQANQVPALALGLLSA